jgi:hypothetical protein
MTKSAKNTTQDSAKDFDLQFNKIIKNIISEEKYFKEENIKQLMKDILKEIDPLIAKYVKNHIKEIAIFTLSNIDKEEKDAKTS